MYPPKLVGLNANRKLVFGTQPGVNVSLDSNVSGNQQTTLAMKNATNNQTAYSYKGVYSGTTQYFKGENVLYGQTFWLALQNALGQTPATGSASWQAIASYNAFQGAWSSTPSYVVGDEVTSGGNFWVARAENTNSLPSTSNANWQIAGPVSLANVADDPLGTWRKVGGVGTGNLVGFKSLVGDTSGDNTTSLVDTNTKSFLHATMSTPTKTTVASAPDTNGSYLQHGVVFNPHLTGGAVGFKNLLGDTSGDNTTSLIDAANKRFLHGAMSGATQNTVAGTADINGSYLQHGVVFQPHIHANQIGWGHFIGDTSGNYSGNLVDGLNLRFLHGAMSTGVQGVISSGAQLTVNPSGGVTGNLPYANHDASVRTTLASAAGGDGSYLNTSQVFNRHLNQATQSGLADDATYLRWKASQQTAMSKPSQGHINDPTFTSVADFWSNFGTASAGVFTLPAMTANQGFGPGAYNQDGRGNFNQIQVQPGDVVVMQITCVTAATGTVATNWAALFVNAAGADQGVYAVASAGAAGTTSKSAATTVPANAVGMRIYFQGHAGVSGGNNASVSNPVVRINHETVADANALKAYADFTDNTPGGHVGKTQSNIADDSNAKMFRFGTLAGRPSAGTAGRIYHASDAGTNGITYRDTGSAWVGMAVGHLADISGTLDNTNDGSSRFAVAAVDPNKKALIDYSQPGHTNANLQYFGGIQSGTCYDGQAITFNPVYSSIPLVFFPANGMTYSSGVGSAASQSLAFTASSLTTSGFTASLKLVTGGTLTARSDNFSAVVAGSEYQATLTNAPAYNNQYTVNWALSLGSASAGTVTINETNSTGPILFSKNYVTGQNGTKATGVTWSGATGTSVIDINLVLTSGTGTISASTVTFTSGTAPSTNSAVPSTAPILWIALPQT